MTEPVKMVTEFEKFISPKMFSYPSSFDFYLTTLSALRETIWATTW